MTEAQKILHALVSLRPGISVSIPNDGSYKDIEWRDDTPRPAEQEVLAEIERLDNLPPAPSVEQRLAELEAKASRAEAMANVLIEKAVVTEQEIEAKRPQDSKEGRA